MKAGAWISARKLPGSMIAAPALTCDGSGSAQYRMPLDGPTVCVAVVVKVAPLSSGIRSVSPAVTVPVMLAATWVAPWTTAEPKVTYSVAAPEVDEVQAIE